MSNKRNPTDMRLSGSNLARAMAILGTDNDVFGTVWYRYYKSGDYYKNARKKDLTWYEGSYAAKRMAGYRTDDGKSYICRWAAEAALKRNWHPKVKPVPDEVIKAISELPKEAIPHVAQVVMIRALPGGEGTPTRRDIMDADEELPFEYSLKRLMTLRDSAHLETLSNKDLYEHLVTVGLNPEDYLLEQWTKDDKANGSATRIQGLAISHGRGSFAPLTYGFAAGRDRVYNLDRYDDNPEPHNL